MIRRALLCLLGVLRGGVAINDLFDGTVGLQAFSVRISALLELRAKGAEQTRSLCVCSKSMMEVALAAVIAVCGICEQSGDFESRKTLLTPVMPIVSRLLTMGVTTESDDLHIVQALWLRCALLRLVAVHCKCGSIRAG